MEEPKKLPLKVVGLNECSVYYANVIAMRGTPHDLQLVMCDAIDSNAENMVAKAVARVIMSPEQAEVLSKQLQLAIEGFIKNFGPLREKSVNAIQLAVGNRPPTSPEPPAE